MRVPKQLLIVEDDRHSREGYRTYLSGAGFNVHALDGGADALHVAKASPPDLVVLDLGLPDVDGWEVARQLKSDDQTKGIPIIAFSGRSMQHEQVSALRAGCDIYLTKPCAPDRLLSTIRKLLGLADPSAENPNADAERDPY
jgi:two-component system cell cycle response regulator DivK